MTRPDASLLLGRQTSKWSLWDVVFHENNTIYIRLRFHFIKKKFQQEKLHSKTISLELFSWKTTSHKDHLEVCLPIS